MLLQDQLQSALAPGLGDMASDLVRGIHIRSNYTPDLDIDLRKPSDPKTAAMLRKLQPQIVVDTTFGPVTIAPYGAPGPTQWNDLLAGLGGASILVLGLALYGGWKLTLGRR
jgi:hypothetical protein